MSRLLCVLYLIGGFFLLGCAAEPFRPSPAAGPSSHQTITALTEKAAAYEIADEIQLAMLCWRRILVFEPDHSDALANLERLQNVSAERARTSFQSAEETLAQKRPKDARRALLLTLRLDPQFDVARKHLEEFMNPPVFQWHQLSLGESLVDLSNKYYRTPAGADLIAFVNDIPVNEEVRSPRTLKIPVLAAQPPYDNQKRDQDLARARALSKAGRHEKMLVITDRLLRANPNLDQAVVLQNNSLFILGRRFYRQQQYLEAKQLLDKISGPHEGLPALRTALEAKMKQQAEIYYRDGVKYFLNEELQRAVEAWRLALALYPEHQEAAGSIREAEILLKKLNTVDHE
jgi:tetratricopeptide (TPR) repeat protein